jgi:hypothetical protein
LLIFVVCESFLRSVPAAQRRNHPEAVSFPDLLLHGLRRLDIQGHQQLIEVQPLRTPNPARLNTASIA